MENGQEMHGGQFRSAGMSREPLQREEVYAQNEDALDDMIEDGPESQTHPVPDGRNQRAMGSLKRIRTFLKVQNTNTNLLFKTSTANNRDSMGISNEVAMSQRRSKYKEAHEIYESVRKSLQMDTTVRAQASVERQRPGRTTSFHDESAQTIRRSSYEPTGRGLPPRDQDDEDSAVQPSQIMRKINTFLKFKNN